MFGMKLRQVSAERRTAVILITTITCLALPYFTHRERRTGEICQTTQYYGFEDGFGSQYQNILASLIYSQWTNKTFCASPITAIHHEGFDNSRTQVLVDVGKMLHIKMLEGDAASIHDVVILPPMKAWFDNFISSKAGETFSLRILQDVGQRFASDVVRKQKHAVVHVREPNRFDLEFKTDMSIRSLGIHVICRVMRAVHSAHGPIDFHVYSQGDAKHFDIFRNDTQIQLHLDAPLNSTFQALVTADILISARSSLSYTAGLISRGEVWAPVPFWHNYPSHWTTYTDEHSESTGACLFSDSDTRSY